MTNAPLLVALLAIFWQLVGMSEQGAAVHRVAASFLIGAAVVIGVLETAL